jgi:D-methionine transport system substrate-binding protein
MFKEYFMHTSSRSPLYQLRQALAAVAVAITLVAAPAAAQEQPLRVGVTAGPHAQIGEVVKQHAEKQGLQVKLIEFSDFIQPNAALDAGDLDINIYQHRPFLESQNSARGYKLTPVANAVVQQMGLYSKRHKSLADLPNGARIAIPNDPTNGARALLVLQAAKLIELNPGITVTASLFDIAENPKKLKFVEIEAAQLPHSLADVDAAAVNSAYAIPAGLSPTKDSLALETQDAEFAVVVIAAREDNKADPRIARFVKAYQSDETKQFVEKTFPGAYTTAW